MGAFIVGDRVEYRGRKATVVCDNLDICNHYLLKLDDGAGWRGRDNHHVRYSDNLHHLFDVTGLWWCEEKLIVIIEEKGEYEIDE